MVISGVLEEKRSVELIPLSPEYNRSYLNSSKSYVRIYFDVCL